MKILVTGGAGFIGSNFILKCLTELPSTEVTVFDSLNYAADQKLMSFLSMNYSNFNFIQGNLCNASETLNVVKNKTHIYHFAAETHVTRSIADNDIFFQTDVIGTKNLVQAIATHSEHLSHFFHISTSEVYGDAESAFMTEDHPLNPKSPYAAAKLGADRLVYAFSKTYGIPSLIVRPFNQFGPRQHIEKVIPRFITNAILGEDLVLHGNGSSQRDYLFIDDFVDFLISTIENNFNFSGEVVNIGSGKSISVSEIANNICKIFGKSFTIHESDDRPGQVKRHTASYDKAKELFFWEPKTSFGEGLIKTVKWYQSNQEFWKRQLWSKEVTITLPNGKVVKQ